jgi:hypothetical protein
MVLAVADMMHRTAPNPSGRARFAQFPGVLLREPMNFGAPDFPHFHLHAFVCVHTHQALAPDYYPDE